MKYKVLYYMTAGSLARKYFDSLHEAIQFSIKSVRLDNLFSIDRVE